MNFEPAVNFMVGAVLVSVSVFFIAMFLLLLNNIFSKYWKPVRIVMYTSADNPYLTQTHTQEKIEPKSE
jgi:hypothetical protein